MNKHFLLILLYTLIFILQCVFDIKKEVVLIAGLFIFILSLLGSSIEIFKVTASMKRKKK